MFLKNPIFKKKIKIRGCPFFPLISLYKSKIPLMMSHVLLGLNHTGLFRISGSAAKIRALRLKYDQGEEVDLVKEGDINTVASLLKLFLNQLPTAVFPENLSNKNCTTEQTRCLKWLLSSLPEAHSHLACFLIRFLTKVAANSDVNQMTLENLAIVFSPTLFRCMRSTQENCFERVCRVQECTLRKSAPCTRVRRMQECAACKSALHARVHRTQECTARKWLCFFLQFICVLLFIVKKLVTLKVHLPQHTVDSLYFL
uniref:Rho-GAP domain-containing protein n=1 Tax=Naja naja TaxID=35670 RepID=A0A8C6YEZ1_NAJNA